MITSKGVDPISKLASKATNLSTNEFTYEADTTITKIIENVKKEIRKEDITR